MVVNEFNVLRSFGCPDETNPILIVYPDRMLAFAVAFERFQPIGRGCPEIVQSGRGVQIAELPPRHLYQVGREALAGFAVCDCFSQGVLEALDHEQFCIS